jgi:hypothetical protein
MKKCVKCELTFPDESKFCKICGDPLISNVLINQKELARKSIFEDKLKLDPLNTKLLIEYSEFLFNCSLYSEALPIILKVLVIDDSNSTVNIPLFKTYFKLKMYNEALDISKSLPSDFLNNVDFLLDKAVIEQNTGNTKKALEYCENVLLMNPSNIIALNLQAQLFLEIKDINSALKCYQKLYYLGDKDSSTIIYNGIHICIQGEYDKASIELTNLLSKIEVANYDIHCQRGLIYLSFCLCKLKHSQLEIDKWYTLIDFPSISDFLLDEDEEMIADTLLDLLNITVISKSPNINQIMIDNFLNQYYYNAKSCLGQFTQDKIALLWINISSIQEGLGLLCEAQSSLINAKSISQNFDYNKKTEALYIKIKQNEKKENRLSTIFISSFLGFTLIFILSWQGFLWYKEYKYWKKAEEYNTFNSYQEYLDKYPAGKYIDNAMTMKEDALWQEAVSQKSLEKFELYRLSFPEGRYVKKINMIDSNQSNNGIITFYGTVDEKSKRGIGIGIYDAINNSSSGIYKGEWINNLKDGTGEMRWINGDYYIGEWSNNYIAGKGKYVWYSKDWYDGEWYKGLKHGEGVYYNSINDRLYYGKLENDKGTLYSKDGYSIMFY